MAENNDWLSSYPEVKQNTSWLDQYPTVEEQKYTSWEDEGAPSYRRYIAGGSRPEDRFSYIKSVDPNAVQYGDDNYIYREPDTGKLTLWNQEGWLPTWGDLASIAPEGAEIAGGALAAAVAAPGALAGAIPSGGTSLLMIPAAYGLGATGGRELENLIATNLAGRVDTRDLGERLNDAATVAAWNTAGEMLGPALSAGASKIASGVKELLPGGKEAAEKAAAEKLASATNKTIPQLQEELGERIAGQRSTETGIDIGTGAMLNAPDVSAAERAFIGRGSNLEDDLIQARSGAFENARTRMAPEGNVIEPQRAASSALDNLRTTLDDAERARTDSMLRATQEGARREAETVAEAAARNTEAARLADELKGSTAKQLAEQQAALTTRQAGERGASLTSLENVLTPGRRAAESSSALADTLTAERALRNKTASGLYSLPDKEVLVPTSPLKEAADALEVERNSLSGVSRSGKYFPLRFMKTWADEGFTHGNVKAGVLEAERVAINQEMEQARSAGNNILASKLKTLRNAVDDALAQAPGVKEQFDQARKYTASQVKEPYLNGISRSIFEPYKWGGLKTQPERMLNNYISPDLKGGATNAEKLLSLLPADTVNGVKQYNPQDIQTIQDFVVDNLRRMVLPPGGKVNAPALTKWIGEHQGALNVIPGLRERIGTVEDAVRSFGDTATRHAEEIKALNVGAEETTKFAQTEAKRIIDEAKATGKSAVEEAKAWAKELSDIASDKSIVNEAKRNLDAFSKSALARAIDREPMQFADELLRSTTWRKDITDTMDKLAVDKDALNGFKRVIFDKAWEDLRGLMFQKSNLTFENEMKRLRPRMRLVFGPETARHFDAVATDVMLSRASFVGPRKAASEHILPGDPRSLVMKWFRRGGGTQTARGIDHIIKSTIAGSGIGTMLGGMPGGIIGGTGTAIAATYETAMGAYLKRIDELYKEIVLDPKLAKSLIDRVITRQNAPGKFRDFIRAYNRALMPGSIPMTYDFYRATMENMLKPELIRRSIAASETD